VLWALSGSFKPTRDLYGADPLPLPGTFANYQVAGRQFPLLRLLFNTLVTATAVTIGHIVIATLAAYALVRLRFRGSSALMVMVTVAVLIPRRRRSSSRSSCSSPGCTGWTAIPG
jgi:multiple sugar transport system permease protein